MRLNRFETLPLLCLYFNNNLQNDRSDKLYKVRPVINALSDRFKKHGGVDEHTFIDENMIIPYPQNLRNTVYKRQTRSI